jgi:DNA modification methylase
MTIRTLIGDCRDILPTLATDSVHCVVTSPPYWGVRDYGTGTWSGGDPECDHSGRKNHDHAGDIGAVNANGNAFRNSSRYVNQGEVVGCICRCGARRIDSQIGLEPTIAEFVAEMVAVFREVRRVLRPDGTCWVNLGDSYNPLGVGVARGKEFTRHTYKAKSGWATAPNNLAKRDLGFTDKRVNEMAGLKPKDLCGIPWRVAFALQADGWYLRQDIIWAKPNPMPESVTDRCTKSHEYIFLLTKSARYFYDAEAIKETASEESGWAKERARGGNTWKYNNTESRINATGQRIESSTFGTAGSRNKRSVWTVATAPFSQAHFATFPPELIEPCIKAGCPKGGTVLDPFGGAGTTGLVADRLQRNAILIELNPKYAEMADRRIFDDAPLLQGCT